MPQRLSTFGGLVAVPVLALGLAACGGSSNDATATDPGSAPSTAATTPAPTSSASSSASTGSSTGSGSGTCTYTASGKAARPVDLPPSTPVTTTKTPATIQLGQGTLDVTLDGDTAPCTVNSFISLAKQGFYDNTPCPRLTAQKGFELLQCGDPSGTTAGGPGYEFDDELTGKETYPAGTLAMANAGPNTNGSQFFIVYGDTQLSPAYTVFGSIDAAGIKILDAIGAKGDDESNPAGGGAPNEKVTIEKVTVQ